MLQRSHLLTLLAATVTCGWLMAPGPVAASVAKDETVTQSVAGQSYLQLARKGEREPGDDRGRGRKGGKGRGGHDDGPNHT